MAFSYREIMDRRNARDRRLSARKRNRRQQMRDQVQLLEDQKRQLEARFATLDEAEAEAEADNEADDRDDPDQAASPSPRRRYLAAIKRVEHLRREKTALLAELSWRELVRNAVQVTVDEANAEAEQAAEEQARQLEPNEDEQEKAILSDLQAVVLREKLCAQVEAILTRLGTMQRLTQLEIFGWSDLRCSDRNGVVDLAVTKRFYRESADALWLKTWENSTNGHDLRIFCRSFFRNEPNFEFHGPNFAATRGPNIALGDDESTGMFVVRTRNLHGGGGGCVLIGELNPNAVASDLAARRPFLRPMYWLFKDVPPDPDGLHDGYALAQFGTTVPAASYEITKFIISELIFSVVRWETLGFRPSLLQWGETTPTATPSFEGGGDQHSSMAAASMYRNPRYLSTNTPQPVAPSPTENGTDWSNAAYQQEWTAVPMQMQMPMQMPMQMQMQVPNEQYPVYQTDMTSGDPQPGYSDSSNMPPTWSTPSSAYWMQ